MKIAFFFHPDPDLPFASFDYISLAHRLIESAEKHGHEVQHLSLKGGPPLGAERIESDGDPKAILLERFKAYCRVDAPAWLLDVDCIVNKPLPQIDADLVLTWRPGFRQVFNTGVIGLMTETGRQMFAEAVSRYKGTASPWGLDQEILLMHFGNLPPGDYEIHGGRLKVLPCELWNYSPESPDEDMRDKYVIHYKGNRKAFAE